MIPSLCGMARYHHKAFTRLVGERLKKLREAANFDIEDIVAMTGFHRNTIASIEKGANTDLSHLFAYLSALQTHPKKFFDFPLELKPLYALPATRKEKNRLTFRTKSLIDKGFFDTPRSTREVCEHLKSRHPEAANLRPATVSIILKRHYEEGLLDRYGPKNRYLYQRKKTN